VTLGGDLFSKVDYFRRPSAAAAQGGHPQNSRPNSPPMRHASVKRFRPHNVTFTITNAGISRSCCTSMGTKEWELCCTTPASEKAECRASRVRSNFYYTIRLVSRSIGELRSCIVGELAYEFDSSFRIRIQRGWPMRFRQKHAASEQRVDRPAHRPLSSKKRWLGIQLSFPWQRFVNAGGAERKIREHRPGRPLR
jgi:hypothetical protein